MPLRAHHRPLARYHLMPHLARLPVPETHIPPAIPAHHKLPVWTHAHVNRIARVIMPAETLLPVLSEAVRGRVHDDLVIAGLKRDVFP